MDALLQQLADTLGGIGADPRVGLVVRILVAYVIALWLACALWAFVDMRHRSGSLIAPYVSAALVVLASPILFPFALLLHAVVRPRIPIAERRVAALREAAMAAEVEIPTCPSCRHAIDRDWLLCPRCRVTLAHRCERCGQTGSIDWDACAWCGASFEPAVRSIGAAR